MSGGSTPVRVAIVQRPPVLLDRAASMLRALESLAEAVSGGARLVVFPESYLPGYPAYIWRLGPEEHWDLAHQLHGWFMAESVDLHSDDLAPLQAAARSHACMVIVGVSERDGSYSRATLYDTLVVIGPDGTIVNRHRKLVLTNIERTVWAPGDAWGLRVIDSPAGRLGALICWENFLPLARQALYAQGLQIHVASTWDRDEPWLSAMRHIANEGRCWVLGAGYALQVKDVPASLPLRDKLWPDAEAWINHGDSVVFAPRGVPVAGPLRDTYGILYADCDPAAADEAHFSFDAAGHYDRPDIFELTVHRRRPTHVNLDDEASPSNLPSTPSGTASGQRDHEPGQD